MEINGFAKFFDKRSSPLKRKSAAASKRAEKREKEKAEQKQLFRMWKKWHADRLQELKAGTHADAAQVLSDFLNRMTIENGDALIELVQSQCWREAARDIRNEALSMIDARCIMLREKLGLEPFDDDLSEQPDTVFLKIRGEINGY